MIRLAHLVSHPIQYFAPLYREIARASGVDFTVFFGSRFGVEPSFDEGFSRTVQFDVPLLSGYAHAFLPNRGSGEPVSAFANFDCPAIGQHLAAGRFDALWVHGWGYRAHWQAFRAARRLGLPYLVRSETNAWSRPAGLLRRLARAVFVGPMLRAAAGCLYVGQSNRTFLRTMGVREDRLFPALYAIDGTRFASAAPRDRQALRQRFGAGPDNFVAVTVAKAIRRKRLPDAIRAVGRAGPRVHLWVLGDGPERPRLEALARAEAPDRVVWHGFVNQSGLPALLSAADVFVLASDDEPWGLAVNEAMACGLPVVCSDRVGCAPDLVRDGTTGYSYPVGDVQALAERLRRLQGQPDQARRLGEAARELVLRDYDVTTTARQVIAAAGAVRSSANNPAGSARG
jgi:glycosyltransferase involved in cell wall biosynthesis